MRDQANMRIITENSINNSLTNSQEIKQKNIFQLPEDNEDRNKYITQHLPFYDFQAFKSTENVRHLPKGI